MSGIPSQVEEAAELANQLHEQMFEQTPPVETVEDEPIAEEALATEDEVVPHDDDVEELRKFKSRYMSLKGKYDAEVPRLSQELRELKDSVFQKLEQATKPAATVAEDVDPTKPDFMSEFAENYGEDFADNLKQLIALEAAKLTQPVQTQVKSIEDNQVKVAQDNFISYIDTNLNEGRDKPLDWQGLWAGKDPKFLEFLEQPDPSGLYTYKQLAELYNENWDADKLVSIFKLYDKTTAAPAAPTKTKPIVTSPAKEALVAPSRTNTHTAPSTESKQVWTKSMIEEFQKSDRQGKYSSEDSKAMWEDLLSAVGENRIR
jgi:hypothetical protein